MLRVGINFLDNDWGRENFLVKVPVVKLFGSEIFGKFIEGFHQRPRDIGVGKN